MTKALTELCKSLLQPEQLGVCVSPLSFFLCPLAPCGLPLLFLMLFPTPQLRSHIGLQAFTCREPPLLCYGILK